MTRLRQFFCGLRGHDRLPKFDPDRLFLKCTTCGHETPGWSLTEVPPTVTAPTRVASRLSLLRQARLA